MEFETAVTIPWKTEEIRRRSWRGRRNFTLPASLTMRSAHPRRWTPQALRASLHSPDQGGDRAGPGTEESARFTPSDQYKDQPRAGRQGVGTRPRRGVSEP